MDRSVHVVMLTGDWRPYDQVKDSLYSFTRVLAQKPGWSVTLSTRRGSSMIPHARNAALSQFLHKGGTDLIFIDADNYCAPEALLKLLDWPVDVVGIPCRSKSGPVDVCDNNREGLTWPIRFLHDVAMVPIDPVSRLPRHDGLMPVETVGTGILRITRACFEKMIEGRDDWYHDPTSEAKKSWPLFEYKIDRHEFWGEDVWFCLQWRKMGGEVWIDPHTETFHIGPCEYRGSVANWLSRSSPRMEVKNYVDNGFHKPRTEEVVSVVNGFVPQRRETIANIAAKWVEEELAA